MSSDAGDKPIGGIGYERWRWTFDRVYSVVTGLDNYDGDRLACEPVFIDRYDAWPHCCVGHCCCHCSDRYPIADSWCDACRTLLILDCACCWTNVIVITPVVRWWYTTCRCYPVMTPNVVPVTGSEHDAVITRYCRCSCWTLLTCPGTVTG